jgi:hypothetical protein
MPQRNNNISEYFHKNIRISLIGFIRQYTPYLGNAMTQITSNFTDDHVGNFALLVAGVSQELARIKKDTKEGKSDNPLADVKGVCLFWLAAYFAAMFLTLKDLPSGGRIRCFRESVYGSTRLLCLGGKRGNQFSETLLESNKGSHRL